jgi:hypothetical protein
VTTVADQPVGSLLNDPALSHALEACSCLSVTSRSILWVRLRLEPAHEASHRRNQQIPRMNQRFRNCLSPSRSHTTFAAVTTTYSKQAPR